MMAEKGKHPVAMRPGGTPVPIPNTKVKPREADDTAGTRESRWPPELKKNKGSAIKCADKRIEEKGITGPYKKRGAYSSAG